MAPFNIGLFATSTSGIGALGVNLTALIIQLITFILAFLVLRKWAFRPIIKILQARRQVVEDGVRLGEKMRQDEKKLEEKIEVQLHKTRIEADKIIAEANEASKQLIREAEAQAKERAAIILKESEEKANLELARAKRKVEADLVSLVAQATSIVLDEKVDETKDAHLIEKALSSSKV